MLDNCRFLIGGIYKIISKLGIQEFNERVDWRESIAGLVEPQVDRWCKTAGVSAGPRSCQHRAR